MKKLDLPDVIKTKIGTIKTDIYELKYQTGIYLASGISYFYSASESDKSYVATVFSIFGAGLLALSTNQIERIKEKRRIIEEYEQDEYIYDNIDLGKEQNQFEMDNAKLNFRLCTKNTLSYGILFGVSTLTLGIFGSNTPELISPTILSGGLASLEGYRALKERRKVKQLEKNIVTNKGSKQM